MKFKIEEDKIPHPTKDFIYQYIEDHFGIDCLGCDYYHHDPEVNYSTCRRRKDSDCPYFYDEVDEAWEQHLHEKGLDEDVDKKARGKEKLWRTLHPGEGPRCPKCQSSLSHFSGGEGQPECLYCPKCRDVAYELDGEEIIGKIK